MLLEDLKRQKSSGLREGRSRAGGDGDGERKDQDGKSSSKCKRARLSEMGGVIDREIALTGHWMHSSLGGLVAPTGIGFRAPRPFVRAPLAMERAGFPGYFTRVGGLLRRRAVVSFSLLLEAVHSAEVPDIA